MSEPQLHTAVYRDLAGRRRKLELRLGEIAELERLCGAGIAAVLVRLSTMQWRYDDIRETVRLGLMGGGASEPEATAIVMRALDPAPKGAHLQLAADVVNACVMGVAPGKDEGEGAASAAPATSPPSMSSPAPCA
jgi:hypothetical protein